MVATRAAVFCPHTVRLQASNEKVLKSAFRVNVYAAKKLAPVVCAAFVFALFRLVTRWGRLGGVHIMHSQT